MGTRFGSPWKSCMRQLRKIIVVSKAWAETGINNRVGENQTWKIGSPSGSEDATTGVKFRSRRPGKLSPESWTETESFWPRQSSGQLQEVLGHVGWPLTRSGLGNDQCGEENEERVLGRKGASLHQRYAPTHDQRFWLNWSGEGPWHWYFLNIFWVITGSIRAE